MTRPSTRSRRTLLALSAAGLSALSAATASAAANPVDSLIDRFGKGHPTTSALVERLDPAGPVTVASWRPGTALAPASTMKIITSASALLTVGADFRFTTRVESRPGATVSGPALRGSAYLIGAGDPMLSTPAYSRSHLAGTGTSIDALARSVRASGIRHVTGGIVVDESLFDSKRMGPYWKSGYVLECPPLAGIATNQNHSDRGGNTPSPAVAAGQRFAAALRANGVTVSGAIRQGRDAPGGKVIGQVHSQPLSRILGFMNPESDNFTAETLAKDVGAYGTGHGTTPAGTGHAERLLRDRGILGASDDFKDGSGLSHSNRVSAVTLVGTLAAASAEPEWGDALIRSLPHGGQGTLIRRLKAPGVRTRVRAKTGYIDGVASLAGVVTSTSGTRYAFAFLINDSDIRAAQATMDRAVTMLATGQADSAP